MFIIELAMCAFFFIMWSYFHMGQGTQEFKTSILKTAQSEKLIHPLMLHQIYLHSGNITKFWRWGIPPHPALLATAKCQNKNP